jgi:hypothetical protein
MSETARPLHRRGALWTRHQSARPVRRHQRISVKVVMNPIFLVVSHDVVGHDVGGHGVRRPPWLIRIGHGCNIGGV